MTRDPAADVTAHRAVTPATRRLLLVATVLVVLAGTSLVLAPEQTDEWFAWTVSPALTAAVLGAGYWASAAVEWTSARAQAWAHARVAVPGVFTFTLVTFVVTVLHLDKFHLASDASVRAQVIAWGWLAIYAVVPVLMALVWWQQRTVPGDDPPRSRRLPGWLRTATVGMAVVLGAVGTWMLVSPSTVATWWPWDLTALTGRAIGAWLVGLAVSAASVVAEDDARRARPVAVGAVALPVLTALALLRFSADVDWGSPIATVVVVALVAWAAIGVALLVLDRRGASR